MGPKKTINIKDLKKKVSFLDDTPNSWHIRVKIIIYYNKKYHFFDDKERKQLYDIYKKRSSKYKEFNEPYSIADKCNMVRLWMKCNINLPPNKRTDYRPF